jgi:staphylococcal nuclease domain-containing protein 1
VNLTLLPFPLTFLTFRILLPRDNVTLTLVLAGIRAPKTARNESEKSEPYGPEAAAFASHRYMQRDVEIEFDAVDKSGGFIGAMFVNRTENAAITLVKEGLAGVHAYSAEGLSWSKQLLDAEAEAKTAKKGVSIQYHPQTSSSAMSEQMTLVSQSRFSIPKVHLLPPMVSC